MHAYRNLRNTDAYRFYYMYTRSKIDALEIPFYVLTLGLQYVGHVYSAQARTVNVWVTCLISLPRYSFTYCQDVIAHVPMTCLYYALPRLRFISSESFQPFFDHHSTHSQPNREHQASKEYFSATAMAHHEGQGQRPDFLDTSITGRDTTPAAAEAAFQEQISTERPLDDSFKDRPIACQEQSRLLRLPGELRNKIYSYVLDSYDDHELIMLPVLLCDPNSPFALHARDRDNDNISNEDESFLWGRTGRMANWNDSITKLGSANMVWHEVNQLKYVCRQLCFETRSLGLRGHSKLCFPNHPILVDDAPAVGDDKEGLEAKVVRFLKTITPTHLADLDTIFIDKSIIMHKREQVRCIHFKDPEKTHSVEVDRPMDDNPVAAEKLYAEGRDGCSFLRTLPNPRKVRMTIKGYRGLRRQEWRRQEGRRWELRRRDGPMPGMARNFNP